MVGRPFCLDEMTAKHGDQGVSALRTRQPPPAGGSLQEPVQFGVTGPTERHEVFGPLLAEPSVGTVVQVAVA